MSSFSKKNKTIILDWTVYKGFENAGEVIPQAFVNETPAPIGESPVNEKKGEPRQKNDRIHHCG